jgi:hypothetical protein
MAMPRPIRPCSERREDRRDIDDPTGTSVDHGVPAIVSEVNDNYLSQGASKESG